MKPDQNTAYPMSYGVQDYPCPKLSMSEAVPRMKQLIRQKGETPAEVWFRAAFSCLLSAEEASKTLSIRDIRDMRDYTVCRTLLLHAMEHYYNACAWLQDEFPEVVRAKVRFYGEYPVHRFSPAQRADAIWKAFLPVRKDVASPPVGALALTSFVMKDWVPFAYLTAHIGVYFDEDDKPTLYFKPDSDPVTIIPLLYILRHAPKSLLSEWGIDPGISGTHLPDSYELCTGESISCSGLLVRTSSRYGNDRVELDLYSPELAKAARSHGSEALSSDADELVGLVIGTLNRVALVSGIHIVMRAPSAEHMGLYMSLQYLRRLLLCNHFPVLDKPEDLFLSLWTPVRPRRNADPDAPRSDIRRGETLLPALEQAYWEKNTAPLDFLDMSGVGNWFLSVPSELCQGAPQAFLRKLETVMAAEVGDRFFLAGWAEGTDFFYVDFLEFDSIPVLAALKEFFMRFRGGGDVRICSFRYGSKLRTLSVEDEEKALQEELHRLDPDGSIMDSLLRTRPARTPPTPRSSISPVPGSESVSTPSGSKPGPVRSQNHNRSKKKKKGRR